MRGFIKGVAPSTSLSFFLFLRKYLGPYGENCTFLKKKWLIIVDSQIFKLYLRPEIKRKNEIDYRFIHYYFLIYNIMNKTEFINAVAEKAGLSKVDGKKAVEAMVKTIQGEMKKGEKVSILGFGSFSVVEKASRKGVNPQTKKVINIHARKVIKFKPGTDLTRVVK